MMRILTGCISAYGVMLLGGCVYDPWEDLRYESDSYCHSAIVADSWKTTRHRVNGVALSFDMLGKHENGNTHRPYLLRMDAHQLCRGEVQVEIRGVTLKGVDGQTLFCTNVSEQLKFKKNTYAGFWGRSYEYMEAFVGHKIPDVLDPRDGRRLIAEIQLVVRRRELKTEKFSEVPAVIKVMFTPKVNSGWFKFLT